MLLSDGTLIDDDGAYVVQFQSSYLTLILEKIPVITHHGRGLSSSERRAWEIDPDDVWAQGDVRAEGVVGHDGCIYFAPCHGSRVLRVASGGDVEHVGPKITG